VGVDDTRFHELPPREPDPDMDPEGRDLLFLIAALLLLALLIGYIYVR
jgi:hypothetical protein